MDGPAEIEKSPPLPPVRLTSSRWHRRPRRHSTAVTSHRRLPDKRKTKKKPHESPLLDDTSTSEITHHRTSNVFELAKRSKSQCNYKTDELESNSEPIKEDKRRSRSNRQLRKNTNSVCHNCEELALKVAHLSKSIVYFIPNSSAVNFFDSSVDNNSSGPISFDSGIEQNNSLTYREVSSPYSSPRLCVSPVKNTRLTNDWNSKLVNEYNYVKCKRDISDVSDLIYLHNTRSIETQTDEVTGTDQTVPNYDVLDINNVDFSDNQTFWTSETECKIQYFPPFDKKTFPLSNNFDADSEVVYQSDCITTKDMEKMSIGTNPAHTTMKSSFSLSSLRVGPGTESEKVSTPSKDYERPYNSLTKKRKDPNRELWRRSWGSNHSTSSALSSTQKDDFWAALQQNYDYIMNNHLIDSCKEASGELSKNNSHTSLLTASVLSPLHKSVQMATSQGERFWSLQQLLDEYEDICNWLKNMEDELHHNPEVLTNNDLRLARLSYITSNDYRRRRWLSHAVNLSSCPQQSTQSALHDTDLTWRAAQLTTMWDNLVKLLTPSVPVMRKSVPSQKSIDIEQTVRDLRRWLHAVEGRLRPLTGAFATARRMSRQQLLTLMDEYQVLEREIKSRGSAVRAVGAHVGYEEWGEGGVEEVKREQQETSDRRSRAARGVVSRWHALYLRAIEWRLHLDACLQEINNKRGGGSRGNCSVTGDSDEEPALKHPRLTRPLSVDSVDGLIDSGLAYNRDTSTGSEADSEDSATEEINEVTMASLRDVMDMELPKLDDQVVVDSFNRSNTKDADVTLEQSMYDESILKTPPTVIKRKKPRDAANFKQSDRKSKNCGTFYFKHLDTDSDANVKSGTSEYEENAPDDTSGEEWTYTDLQKHPAVEQKDADDKLDEVVQNDCNQTVDKLSTLAVNVVTTNVETVQQLLCIKDMHRLVNEAEELVQKKAQQQNASVEQNVKPKKFKISKTLPPWISNEEEKGITSQVKLKRIKDWLKQYAESSRHGNTQQPLDSCDASGEYTTGDSELDRQSASSSEDLTASASTFKPANELLVPEETISATNSPTHNSKVTMRERKSNNNTRPWSVSCLSQLTCVSETQMSGSYMNTQTMDNPDLGTAYGRSAGMSISESALNTIAGQANIGDVNASNAATFQGSTSSVKTTVQGNISSSTTINETCLNCSEHTSESTSKKRVRLRRKHDHRLSADLETGQLRATRNGCLTDRLVKSCSFSGRLTSRQYHKHDRNTASDPSFSRNKMRYESSTSDNDSDENSFRKVFALIKSSQKRKSEQNAIVSTSDDPECAEQKQKVITPSFKYGPDTGKVRPRILSSAIKDKSIVLGLSLQEKQLWDLNGDSDVDRSIKTAGTEEHSSFSEQAWDFYQEKYNSEPYSEAPDSEAARQLLEFGDDYRAYLGDSQSDCCSSLSTHPDHEKSPTENNIRNRHSTDNLLRYRKPGLGSTPPEICDSYGSFGRKYKKSPMSSAERKKSLLDSLERSKRSPGKKAPSGSRRSNGEGDVVTQATNRRRYPSSNSTSSDMRDSSLEYPAANLPIYVQTEPRTRKPSNESNKGRLPSDARKNDMNPIDSPARRRRPRSANPDESADSHHQRRRVLSLNDNIEDVHDASYELQDVRELLDRSQSQLDFTEAVFAKQDTSPELIHPNDYNELAASRTENIRCLEAILAGADLGDRSLLSPARCKQIQGLLRRWRSTDTRGGGVSSRGLGGVRGLRRAVLALRGAVLALGDARPHRPSHSPRTHTIHTRQHLHRRIDALKERISQLAEYRSCMARLSAAVRRLSPQADRSIGASESSEPVSSPDALSVSVHAALHDELADLYRTWQDIHDSISMELASLESVLEAWVSWESGLRELRDLKDLALIADTHQTTRSTDDSGISDGCSSGSERGVGSGGPALLAVQKSLQALRTAAKRLRDELAPTSKAIFTMHQRMEEAEREVAMLLAAVGAGAVTCLGQDGVPEIDSAGAGSNCSSPADPDPSPGGNGWWVWRVARGALPLQVALLALLCAAWLLEPRCCDTLNSLHTSFAPHLRYVRGPPPI